MSDDDLRRKLSEINAYAAFNLWTGFEVASAEAGQVELRMAWKPEAAQYQGDLHAGVVGARLDTACGFEAFTQVGPTLASHLIPSATMIWAAGVQVPHLKSWLPGMTDRTGRALVEPDLSLRDHPEAFVVGDAAAAPWKQGTPAPGIAPAAKQGGRYAAEVVAAAVAGRPKPAPFHYRHQGDLATIGRHAAIVNFGRVSLTGWLAWWIWGLGHIHFLIGVRAPMIVAAQRFWAYLTFGRGARLITGAQSPEPNARGEAPARPG